MVCVETGKPVWVLVETATKNLINKPFSVPLKQILLMLLILNVWPEAVLVV